MRFALKKTCISVWKITVDVLLILILLGFVMNLTHLRSVPWLFRPLYMQFCVMWPTDYYFVRIMWPWEIACLFPGLHIVSFVPMVSFCDVFHLIGF